MLIVSTCSAGVHGVFLLVAMWVDHGGINVPDACFGEHWPKLCYGPDESESERKKCPNGHIGNT